MKTLASLLVCSSLALSSACHNASGVAAAEDVLPWKLREASWRTDAAWYDGTAEKAVYRATRSIYGVERRYQALAYTNKQGMDPSTSTKAASSGGIEVFKHHWSERVETEKYDYDFSTASFSTTAKLTPFKLTAATQEDCGASFKQVWFEGQRLRHFEAVYFPDAGVNEGELDDARFVFEDALPLVLRDFPFGSQEALELRVLPSQKSTKRVDFAPVLRRIVPRGAEQLALPIGERRAWRLDLCEAGGERVLASFWFDAEAAAPWMHVLLRYEGPGGVSYALETHERTAYWER